MELQPAVNLQAPQFAPEVWELVIIRMNTSEDIASLLRAYPGLKGLSKNNQFHWRISEVLWLFLPNYLRDKDKLNCRRVCKFWKRTVDRLLEAHPRRLPYNSARLTEMTELHFTCFKYPEIRTHFDKIFNDVMNNHVIADISGQNPFLGKYLYIYTYACGNQTNLQRMRKIPNFLKLLGCHIHHLAINFYMVHAAETEEMICLLFQSLPFLPNLRSLRIHGKFGCDKETANKVFGKFWGKGRNIYFPVFLNSLDLSGLWFEFTNFGFYTGLLTKINGNQLEKLGLDLGFWNTTLARKLPNLTDLQISYDYEDRVQEKKINPERRLRKMFRVLAKSSSNLKKLSFTRIGFNIYKLLKLLQPYKIEMLDVVDIWTPEKSVKFSPVVRSIKYFKFSASDMATLNLSFLKLLHNLEYLTVKSREYEDSFDEFGFNPKIWDFSHSVFFYVFMNINEIRPEGFSIWEEFSNLKMITVVPEYEIVDVPFYWWRFIRELGNKVLSPNQINRSYCSD